MEKSEIIKAIKNDLKWITEDGFNTDVGYTLLDDDTLAVQTYNDKGNIDKTYIVNVSLGRELEPSEWKQP